MVGAVTNNDLLTGVVRMVLVDGQEYTPDLNNDQFLSDVPVGGRIATSVPFTTKTFAALAFDADDLTYTSVTGDQFEFGVIFIDTTVEATSRLVYLLDTATGIPFTPNGGNIDVTWNAGGIFQL